MSLTLSEYVQRLQQDISHRRLVPGSRYLTAEESARLLGTSVATANRALRVLAEQDIVVRRRNSGTFIGPAVASTATEGVRTVSILAPHAIRMEGAVRFDLLIEGVLASMPDVADVHVSYVPSERGIDFVRGLLEPIQESGRLAGVIATSCSREVYRYLGQHQFPVVILGSLYPDQPYPSIDTDERQAGRMLTEYLIERGHRRIALFSDSESCPGDNHFHDGVSEALTNAQFPHNALIWRAPGPDPAVLKAQVDELLEGPNRPTGFISRLPRWADRISEIARAHGLAVPQDVEIAFKGYAVGEPGKSGFPHVRPQMSARQVAELAGRMLAQVRDREPLDERAVVVPYEMQISPGLGVVE